MKLAVSGLYLDINYKKRILSGNVINVGILIIYMLILRIFEF